MPGDSIENSYPETNKSPYEVTLVCKENTTIFIFILFHMILRVTFLGFAD